MTIINPMKQVFQRQQEGYGANSHIFPLGILVPVRLQDRRVGDVLGSPSFVRISSIELRSEKNQLSWLRYTAPTYWATSAKALCTG